jgi:hypothetical protein
MFLQLAKRLQESFHDVRTTDQQRPGVHEIRQCDNVPTLAPSIKQRLANFLYERQAVNLCVVMRNHFGATFRELLIVACLKIMRDWFVVDAKTDGGWSAHSEIVCVTTG